jgi:uncharacterized phage protein (TIGR01671 family)
MREIKFRGNAKEELQGSQWLTDGFGVEKIEYTDGSNEVYLITPYGDYGVDEKSVGQYTGLKDKNGKGIYEGDILLTEDEELGNSYSFVSFKDGSFVVEEKGFADTMPLSDLLTLEPIVVGNIYDNPDLLKEND